MSGFGRQYLPVGEIRGQVLRRWHRVSEEKRGWNAVPCRITRLLLRDGRLVEQEWPVGVDTPSAHYVVREGARAAEEIEMMDRSPSWEPVDPSDYAIVAGARR